MSEPIKVGYRCKPDIPLSEVMRMLLVDPDLKVRFIRVSEYTEGECIMTIDISNPEETLIEFEVIGAEV